VATSKNTVFCDVKLCILVDIYRRFRRTFCLHIKLTLYIIRMAGEYCSEMSIRSYQPTRRLSQKNVTFRRPSPLFPSHSEVKTRRTQRFDTTINKICALIFGHNFCTGGETEFRKRIKRSAIYCHSLLLFTLWSCQYSGNNYSFGGRNNGSQIGKDMEWRGTNRGSSPDVLLATLMKAKKTHTRVIQYPWWISYWGSSTVSTVSYRFITPLG